MDSKVLLRHLILISGLLISVFLSVGRAQYPEAVNDLDKRVLSFLKGQSGEWQDMNVPVADGRILYDLILAGKYKKALEIGTSTGHSAVWIAWALSKTGGKLVTIEIDKKRYLQAMKQVYSLTLMPGWVMPISWFLLLNPDGTLFFAMPINGGIKTILFLSKTKWSREDVLQPII
jgi:hypothetical protein